MAVHLLGIRHHGPGSARNVREYLERVKPDIILLEGPPEAEAILKWANHAEMKPPVAILAYIPDHLQKSVFYPFAAFSPEWQAIQYALKNNIPLRFIDLPVAHALAIELETEAKEKTEAEITDESEVTEEELVLETEMADEAEAAVAVERDPFIHLARIAGYDDGEKWWENHFEHRSGHESAFEAVNEAVSALRENNAKPEKYSEQCREAWMRKTIRQAEKEMYNDIAVICGAWHVPALQNMPKQKEDNELLKGLPKVKIETTWVPWTYSRLSYTSGYGAGIHSPGWYHHIWNTSKDVSISWLTKTANLFRKNQMDVSSAHIIEAVRLAETLASLRGFSRPGLEELNEATRSVMCLGEDIQMSLIHKELIVSPKIGKVPSESPKPPLQVDIEKTQKQLRLPVSEEAKEITLDLREARDLAKSVFLHRLSLLGLDWGSKRYAAGKGTFKEVWSLRWEPNFAIQLIDKGVWGNSVKEACSNYIAARAAQEDSLRKISDLLGNTLLADLPEATESLLKRIDSLAAASADVMQLMQSLPSLVNALRYGNVRKTDTEILGRIVDGILTRIFIGLPVACVSMDEEAAQEMLELCFNLNEAVSLLQNDEQLASWHKTLFVISGSPNAAPLIAGYATRLIYDYQLLEDEALHDAFALALSPTLEYAATAAWLEGFLKGSGTILLIDDNLWNLINVWVSSLEDVHFTHALPLLRRTFSQFSQPERRKLGEKAKTKGSPASAAARTEQNFDHESGLEGIPIVLELLGIR